MYTLSEQLSLQAMAFQIWEERGRPVGSGDDCWREAEERCRAEQARTAKDMDDALKGSFPASDPPASHIPDEVPVNADAKWAAAARSQEQPAPLQMVRERKRQG